VKLKNKNWNGMVCEMNEVLSEFNIPRDSRVEIIKYDQLERILCFKLTHIISYDF